MRSVFFIGMLFGVLQFPAWGQVAVSTDTAIVAPVQVGSNEGYYLKKTPSGYLWLDANNKYVLEFPLQGNHVREWADTYIIRYQDPNGRGKRYVHDRESGLRRSVFSAMEPIECFPGNDDELYVFASFTSPARIGAIDRSGNELFVHETGAITGNTVIMIPHRVAFLAHQLAETTDTLYVYDQSGTQLCAYPGIEFVMTLEFSKTGDMLLLKGDNIWFQMISVNSGREICRGLHGVISSDEQYIAVIAWGADDLNISPEYAQVLGISAAKVNEAMRSRSGLYGLFVNLYVVEFYSLKTQQLVGRDILDGEYLREGYVDTPAIDSVEFLEDNTAVRIKYRYHGFNRMSEVRFDEASKKQAIVSAWVRDNQQALLKNADSKRRYALELSRIIAGSPLYGAETVVEVKRIRKRVKKAATEEELDALLFELKNIGRKYLARKKKSQEQ